MSSKQFAATLAATVIGGVDLYFVKQKLDGKSANQGFTPVSENQGEFYA